MLKGADYYCTMSMGVVRFPTEGDTVEELIKKADIALYAAKCSGKNRVEFYDENVESTSFRRLDMEKNMRNATRQCVCHEFEVCLSADRGCFETRECQSVRGCGGAESAGIRGNLAIDLPRRSLSRWRSIWG